MTIFSAAGAFDLKLSDKRVTQNRAKPARVIMDAFLISYFE